MHSFYVNKGKLMKLRWWMQFVTLETRGRLERVKFRLDFWGCYQGQGKKNWPIFDRHVTSNDPRDNCGTHFGSSPLLISKVVNVFLSICCSYWHVSFVNLDPSLHSWNFPLNSCTPMTAKINKNNIVIIRMLATFFTEYHIQRNTACKKQNRSSN